MLIVVIVNFVIIIIVSLPFLFLFWQKDLKILSFFFKNLGKYWVDPDKDNAIVAFCHLKQKITCIIPKESKIENPVESVG